MCGICGIIGRDDRVTLQTMVSSLNHRGPDGNGTFFDKGISLGHTRLKIIDLSDAGKQPMSNEDGTIWLVINGEIYNHKELRESLEKNHVFTSLSDSEVVIHLYEEYGLDFIHKIRGMFALALYDQNTKQCILARDPLGKKPLYYSSKDGLLFFASEIKSILAAGILPEVDRESLWSYLLYQYCVGEKTLFQGISKVLPGTILLINNGQMIKTRYWKLAEKVIDGNESYFSDRLFSLLENSVKMRMVADVPIGSFLSGGIDSSIVTAIGKRYAGDEFHTFSMSFETYSEQHYAHIVSSHLKTVHHDLLLTGEMVLSHLPEIAWYYDEPLGDAAIINNYFLSQEAKKTVTVVLTGEGGDEVFAGYPYYKRNLDIWRIKSTLPLLSSLITSVNHLVPRKAYALNQYNAPMLLLRYMKHCDAKTITQFTQNTSKFLLDEEIQELSTTPWFDVSGVLNWYQGFETDLGRMQAIDILNKLPERYLMKADKGTMANAIEERCPLLDVNLVEFAFQIPPSLRISNGFEKYIFRKAAQGLIPKDIIFRKKMGFGTPYDYWMKTDLYDYSLQKICEGAFLKEIVRPAMRANIVKNPKKLIANRPTKAWMLFALELWYDTFFTGTTRLS